MGPDLFGREIATGKAGRAPDGDRLQWGPTCSVGRSARSRPRSLCRRAASMGPDLFGREIGLRSRTAAASRRSRFNGARPVRSGDRARSATNETIYSPLQWGPTCSVGRSHLLTLAARQGTHSFNGARPVRSGDRARGTGASSLASSSFNGARPVRSGDRWARSLDTSRSWTLQWGPTCSVGRSDHRERHAGALRKASMGPDLFGREIARGSYQRGRRFACFNGARPVRSGDRTPPPVTGEVLSACFNGARPVRSGDRLPKHVQLHLFGALQWGPTCSVGRSIRESGNYVRVVLASMGPDLFGREIARSSSWWKEGCFHQASMGPDLFGREIGGGPGGPRGGPGCFNGARPVRSGDRRGRRPPRRGRPRPASMGPDLFGREIVRREVPAPPGLSAGFNGARPVRSGDRRGWRPRACARARCFNGARPVRSGDRPTPAAHPGTPDGFNGARPVRSGDRLLVPDHERVRRPASMGPDLFGREIGPSRRTSQEAGPASMGPDLFGREIGTATEHGLMASSCFNGARPVRSGDRS